MGVSHYPLLQPIHLLNQICLVDSETICPEGETMVPIDQYACNTIAAAGRTNQISPPVNGESSTTCPGAPAGDQGGQQSSSVASPPSPSTSTPPAPAPSSSDRVTGNIADNALEQPKQAAQVQSGSSMQMTCTNTDGGDVPASNGASFLLNCTINA